MSEIRTSRKSSRLDKILSRKFARKMSPKIKIADEMINFKFTLINISDRSGLSKILTI